MQNLLTYIVITLFAINYEKFPNFSYKFTNGFKYTTHRIYSNFAKIASILFEIMHILCFFSIWPVTFFDECVGY